MESDPLTEIDASIAAAEGRIAKIHLILANAQRQRWGQDIALDRELLHLAQCLLASMQLRRERIAAQLA